MVEDVEERLADLDLLLARKRVGKCLHETEEDLDNVLDQDVCSDQK